MMSTVPEFRPDAPVLLACRELWHAMDLFDEAACRKLQIGRSDLRALNELEAGPLAAATLADRLALSRAAVTALVDRLERAGYVERSQDPDDRRSVKVSLLPATWRAFAGVYRPLGVRVLAATADLTDDELHAVFTALASIAGAFAAQGARMGEGSDA
jgi:DNA-binding MarR family transcriptional regulator